MMKGLSIGSRVRDLVQDRSGLALLEFAFVLPILLTMCLGGAELTNFATTRMRVSQIALHLADHAARLGVGSPLQAKTITEADINEVFTGAGLQASELDLYARGRVFISSLEPVATPNTTDRYKIGWQRCRGAVVRTSSYGVAGATNLPGMGPTGSQVKAPEDGATIFVQVTYLYRPIVGQFVPATELTEIASMPVRDRRDLSQIYPAPPATASSCSVYSAT